jgi:hypothetical protein
MIAAEAHKLKIGDWVLARFSGRGYLKKCEITSIDWPTFTLRTTECNGRELVRTRRYENLVSACQPAGPPTESLPAWLEDLTRGKMPLIETHGNRVVID